MMPPPIVMCLRARPLRGSIFVRSGDGMARARPVGTLVLLLGSVRHAMSYNVLHWRVHRCIGILTIGIKRSIK